jgi:hypothetical protein
MKGYSKRGKSRARHLRKPYTDASCGYGAIAESWAWQLEVQPPASNRAIRVRSGLSGTTFVIELTEVNTRNTD